MRGDTYDDVERLVDDILAELGSEIVVGTPLGIGKPNHILNELVERALEDPDLELSIWTALTLSKPDWSSDLERRLVEPLSERLFEPYPNLRYAELLDEEALPPNIDIHQFYYPPGRHMANNVAQQTHHSVNYTHALGAFLGAEPNLLLQLVGAGERDGQQYYNVGTNTDLTIELINSMQQARETGERETMVVGQVTDEMPFMYGDAPIEAEEFDAVLDNDTELSLFAPPNEPVSLADGAIALRVSSLLADGGTLQIGIGSLGDAIGWATGLRHQDNETYREMLAELGVDEDDPLVQRLGGVDTFEEGLYGATEMFVEAFLELYNEGVLSREVYDDLAIQRLVSQGEIDDGIDIEALDRLAATGAIDEELDAGDVAYLREWGVLRERVDYEEGQLLVDGEAVPADLSDSETRAALEADGLGDSLDGGQVLHGGFFMGSNGFYDGLRELPDAERRKLSMTSVQYTNALYGEEELKRLQRRDARFVNTAMKATVMGNVASDGIADGRVVSGVGGQFNFVNQAHELDDGRSIIMLRATRTDGDEVESNIVFNYGHSTIPRHLRDIVVTEYGVADLQHKSDEEVVAEMIKVADSRFQADLAEQAKEAGKLPEEWEVPAGYRNNYPETIEAGLGPYREDGTLPKYPSGSDLTREERHLADALRSLESSMGGDGLPDLPRLDSLRKAAVVPEAAGPYLDRMALTSSFSPKEALLRRVVTLALAEQEYV